MGIYDLRSGPPGFNNKLILRIANDTMADLVTGVAGPGGEYLRFNWKWNRGTAAPFLTNSFQQDYPQLAQPGGTIGWGEDCDKIDINNPLMPQPVNVPSSPKWKRQLSRVSAQSGGIMGGPSAICWMYNQEMYFGQWPGPGVVYNPLISAGFIGQNPIMNFQDVNGNYMILTTFGTTGASAPFLDPGTAEGVTTQDGTCVWTVVSGLSQGFRIWPMPNAAGPVYQMVPYFQYDPVPILTIQQMIDPVPDSFARYFRKTFEMQTKGASASPSDRKEYMENYGPWLQSMLGSAKQGDKEVNAASLRPATSPVDNIWPGNNRYTADYPV